MFRLATALSITMATVAFSQIPAQPGIPESVGVQLKEHNLSTDNIELVKEAGFKWVRRGFLWQGVEKEPGVYNFDKYAKLVQECKDRNLTLIATLALGNDKLYGHVKDEKGRQAYAKYAVAAVERFKGEKHIVWEIWNEPNTMTFWGRHGKKGNTDAYAEEYVNLVNAAVPLMKKADPNCVILGGSVSNLWKDSYEWQDFCFKRGILKSGIDYWSVHPYGLKSPEEYIKAYGIVRGLMEKNGGPILPMLNSERGFTVKSDKGEGDAGGAESMGPEYQAWHFVRQQIIDLYTDQKLTIWYEWSGKEGFSLLNGDRTDTKALKAARVMLKELDGYKLEKRIELENPLDFVFQFKGKDGGVKLVAWTAPPAAKPPEQAEPHDVEITVAAKGTLDTATLYGEPGKVEVGGGKIKLSLTGAPQYVKLK